MRTTRRPLLLGACAAVLAGLWPVVHADATHPGAPGVIAFGLLADGTADVHVAEPDGTGLRRLTTADGFDLCPAWAPDGRWMAFCSDRTDPVRDDEQRVFEIWVMGADGSDQRQVTRHGAFSLFPDVDRRGERIIYMSSPTNEPEDFDLWVVGADGRRARRITETPGLNEAYPAWSPRGNRIVFVGQRLDPATGDLLHSELYSIAPSGRGLQLTDDGVVKDQVPDFSPDGRVIAYAGDDDIWVVRADGHRPTRVTDTPDVAEFGISFSPDGTRLAFLRETGDGRRGLYTMALDGSDVRRVHEVEGTRPAVPAWQPRR